MENDLKFVLDNSFLIQGSKKGKQQSSPRVPIEEPEGAASPSFPRSVGGTPLPGAVSLTKIAVLDLISEGEMEGLVTGEYTYEGTLGSVGWDRADLQTFENAPGTTSKFLRSIYWNEVPVVNSNNEFNFSEVSVVKTNGLPNGANLQLTNEHGFSRQIGERLRYGIDFTKTYRVLNKNVKAVDFNVRVGQLFLQSTDPSTLGDIKTTNVQYQFNGRPLFSDLNRLPSLYPIIIPESITGKITQGYIKTTRIPLYSTTDNYNNDPSFLGWEFKIERKTPEAIDGKLRNQTFIDSLTEIYGDTFTFPNSAIVGSKFSAEYFSQVPERAFDVRGMKVTVPSNYNPITKVYTDASNWDGTFADTKQWTDNPAWCFYDLITNRRYGLGRYIDSSYIDKWTLYEIGKYCDTLVSDGLGGLEPRFTCNLLLNTREEAFKVINDMASIFQAISYYGGGSIYTVQDSEKDPIHEFTNANVENGDFNYSSSSRRVRHTVAIVRYNDKNNFYAPAVEYVEDIDGIRRYGIRELELTAFGCSSRGQAIRLGRWALLTETLETETVSFIAGTEASYVRPGDIIKLYDYNRKGKNYAGRTYQLYDDTRILLDSEITGLNSDVNSLYNFSILTPSYHYDPTQISDLNSSDYSNIRKSFIQTQTFRANQASGITGVDDVVRTDIKFSAAFNTTDYSYTGNLVWMVEASGVTDPLYNQYDYFRIINIEEKENNSHGIAALSYYDNKFRMIESGLDFQDPNLSPTSDIYPPSPTDLQLDLVSLTPFTKKINYRWSIPHTTGVGRFLVYGRTGNWVSEADLTGTKYLINVTPKNVLSGALIPWANADYYFRVYSQSVRGRRSINYAFNDITVNGIIPIYDISISSLRLEDETATNAAGYRDTGIALDESPDFTWQVGGNYNTVAPNDIYYRITTRQPSNSNDPSDNIYFEETGLYLNKVSNLSYTFDFTDNYNAVSTFGESGPFRDYDVVVEAHDPSYNSSAGGNFDTSNIGDSLYRNSNGYDILYVTNPRPTGLNLTDGGVKPNDLYETQQWITTDGDVKIRILSGVFDPDISGGYLYDSLKPFTEGEAYGLTPPINTINNTHFTTKGILDDYISIPANLVNTNNAYIAVSLYDSFDSRLIESGVNIKPLLDLSNIVHVSKRGAFDKDGQLFHAWIEVTLDFRNNIVSNWQPFSAGIENVTTSLYSEKGFQFYDNINIQGNLGIVYYPNWQHTITFKEVLPSNNYVIVDHVDPINIPGLSNSYIRDAEIIKNPGSFTLRGYFGKHFFGVLYNGTA